MFFQKYLLVLQKIETPKNTSKSLEVFKLLGFILGSRIEIF